MLAKWGFALQTSVIQTLTARRSVMSAQLVPSMPHVQVDPAFMKVALKLQDVSSRLVSLACKT
jgi:hypothetical protein